MMKDSSRLKRERKTIEAMIGLACKGRHRTSEGLCPECSALLQYAQSRLEKCPFAERKPTCAKCPIHCYRPDRRNQIREVMRYAGPRMLSRHPVLALFHWLDGRREPPPDPRAQRRPRPLIKMDE
jgi:hypothetical protein